ncbi:hypothetical protein NKH57_01915 [Mesorhizobium sp. M1050]|uniref:hypothetical protein n=1 Tax=Mesorhizobium sp. M1050 TaxID=2957051 RepID=UPI003335FD52
MKSPNLSEVVRYELIRLVTPGVLKPGAETHNGYLADYVLSLFRCFYIVGARPFGQTTAGRMKRVIETQRLFLGALAERYQAKAVEKVASNRREFNPSTSGLRSSSR